MSSKIKITDKTYSPATPYPLATALRAAMPDAEIAQIHFQSESAVSFDTKKFKTDQIVFADSVFSKLFPLHVKQGSIKRALAEPGFAILTEETAHRFFGNENPVGKRIKVENIIEVQVAAVIANAPGNSHLPYSMLVSYASLQPEFIGGFPLDQWGLTAAGFTYIALPNSNKVRQAESVLASIAVSVLAE